MMMTDMLESAFHRLTGKLWARLPREIPGRERLEDCRLVAHRGVYDNRRILENTLPAFEQAAEAGLWGLELDVRFTSDGRPVVLHDPDLSRVFGLPGQVAEMTRQQLGRLCPDLPDLEEVADRFGGRIHLMIEVKDCAAKDCLAAGRELEAVLRQLEPAAEYHLMSMVPGILEQVEWVLPEARVPIAWAAVGRLSRMAIERGWGGVAGHFLLVGKRHLRRHHRAGQKVGTGFADSTNCLWREISRGVDWIFTNQGLRLQRLVARLSG